MQSRAPGPGSRCGPKRAMKKRKHRQRPSLWSGPTGGGVGGCHVMGNGGYTHDRNELQSSGCWVCWHGKTWTRGHRRCHYMGLDPRSEAELAVTS